MANTALTPPRPKPDLWFYPAFILHQIGLLVFVSAFRSEWSEAAAHLGALQNWLLWIALAITGAWVLEYGVKRLGNGLLILLTLLSAILFFSDEAFYTFYGHHLDLRLILAYASDATEFAGSAITLVEPAALGLAFGVPLALGVLCYIIRREGIAFPRPPLISLWMTFGLFWIIFPTLGLSANARLIEDVGHGDSGEQALIDCGLGNDPQSFHSDRCNDHLTRLFGPVDKGWQRDPQPGSIFRMIPEAVNTPDKPLRYNVVTLFLESFRMLESGLLGNKSYAPNLARLAQNGALFTNTYASGSQTVFGEFSSLCSFIEPPGPSIYMEHADLPLRCLPSILADAGYNTNWMCGTKKTFQGTFDFQSVHGIRHFYDLETFGPPDDISIYGANDFVLYAKVHEILNRKPEPFFAHIMTLSSHFPFNVPPEEAKRAETAIGRYRQAVTYSDKALGEFFEAIRGEAWFSNTIFVITGDHGHDLFDKKPATLGDFHDQHNRVPLVIYAPGLIPAGRYDKIVSQIDIAPTLLNLLKLKTPNSFLGHDLFGPNGGEAVWSSLQDMWLRTPNQLFGKTRTFEYKGGDLLNGYQGVTSYRPPRDTKLTAMQRLIQAAVKTNSAWSPRQTETAEAHN